MEIKRKFSYQNKISGFTLIEIVFVVAIMMGIYSVAVPNLATRKQTAENNKILEFMGGLRNAYDYALLNKKVYRFVINLNSGDYWLEGTDKRNFYLSSKKNSHDLTKEEEASHKESFDTAFSIYEELAGESVFDRKKEKEIAPESPVLLAKNKLAAPIWTKVKTIDWVNKSLGPDLIVTQMQAEHHSQPQELEELGVEGIAYVYVFPHGYIEKAVFHITEKLGDLKPSESSTPYTIYTKPWQGLAEMISGKEEIEVDKDES